MLPLRQLLKTLSKLRWQVFTQLTLTHLLQFSKINWKNGSLESSSVFINSFMILFVRSQFFAN